MKTRPHKRRVKPRQLPNEIAPPPALAGISGEATLDPGVVPTGTFAFDASAAPDTILQSAPPLAGTLIPEVTALPASTISDSSVADPTAPVTGASHAIPLSTVVGACVGAFVGACLIIIAGVLFYRRSTRSMKAKHRRADRKAWNQLDDDQDRWDGGMTERTNGQVTLSRSPTEKLGVFKKSPSMRTTRTDKSDVPSFESQTFASYHPKLALELAGAEPSSAKEQASPMGSWRGSLLPSLRNDVTDGAISPSLNKAIPTPVAVTSFGSHHWESAEVVNMDETSAVPVHVPDNSRASNPFFDPKDQEYMARAKENSKGKKREEDPFSDDAQADMLTPASHPNSAIQSIIAALGVGDLDPMAPSPLHGGITSATDSPVPTHVS